MRFFSFVSLVLMVSLIFCGAALSAGIEPPSGPIIERNIDRSAEEAFNNWVDNTLNKAPHSQGIKNIGILELAGDNRNFTELLKNRLTESGKFHVVILRGKDWMAIEDELARTDPDSGWGDIMNKATIKWREDRGAYVLPETTLGTDALLLGRVRSVDTDWLRARTRFSLNLARVDNREIVAGGIAEGESILPFMDMIIYYKVQLVVILGILVALIIILWLIKSVLRAGRRPR